MLFGVNKGDFVFDFNRFNVFLNRCEVVDQMTGKGRKLFVFGKQECEIVECFECKFAF
jgi:hypothetical protein